MKVKFLAVCSILTMVVSCTSSQRAGKEQLDQPISSSSKKLRIIFQGDKVGQAVPCSCFRAPYGGLAREKNALDNLRSESEWHSLYVDAGNMIGKDENLKKGKVEQKRAEAFWALASQLGVEVYAPGLSDYTLGAGFLKGLLSKSKIDLLSSNVVDVKTGKSVFQTSVVRTLAGVKLGFLSLTPEKFINGTLVSSQKKLGIKVIPYQLSLQKQIDDLKNIEKVDVVVLLSQLKIAEAEALPSKFNGINLIVNADSSFATDKPFWFPGKTLLVDSGYQGAYLGQLDLEIELPITGFFSLEEQMRNQSEVDRLEKAIANGTAKPNFTTRLNTVKSSRLLQAAPSTSRYQFKLIPLTENEFGVKNSLTEPSLKVGAM